MNYEKIKIDYPKAWEIFENWLLESQDIKVGIEFVSTICNFRDLYDFFDGEKLIVEVLYNRHSNRYYCCINNNYTSEYTLEFPTRTEAKQAGFGECFEILENKLK